MLNDLQVVDAVQNWENDWGKVGKKRKHGKKRKKKNANAIWPWKKKSIFFDLPYWEVRNFK